MACFDNFELRALLQVRDQKFTSNFFRIGLRSTRLQERRVPQSAMLKSQINWQALKKQAAGSKTSNDARTQIHIYKRARTQTLATDTFSKCTPVQGTLTQQHEQPSERMSE